MTALTLNKLVIFWQHKITKAFFCAIISKKKLCRHKPQLPPQTNRERKLQTDISTRLCVIECQTKIKANFHKGKVTKTHCAKTQYFTIMSSTCFSYVEKHT